MPSIYLVSGSSGAGKGTLCQLLLSRIKMNYSVSCTTREPRPEDIPGVTYNFITKEQFQRMVKQGLFAEWAEVYGDYYGTPKSGLLEPLQRGEDVLLEIEIYGARQIRNLPDPLIQEALCTIFIMPPSKEILHARLIKRSLKDGISKEKLERRLARFDEEIKERHNYHHTVLNDDIVAAFRDLFRIVTNNMASTFQV